MSAWSSATGKAQLSYADRLRQANKSSTPSRQDAEASSAAQRAASQDTSKGTGSAAFLNASGSKANKGTSSSVSANASGSASGSSNHAGAQDGSAAGDAAASPDKSAGPQVNIWEARRKQIAEREAEKERERQAALAQQRKASAATASNASTGINANAAANRGKQPTASSSNAPKKGNERNSKGANNPAQPDRKATKQSNQASGRPTHSVPISSSSSTSAMPAKPNAQASSSKANNVTVSSKSAKEDSSVAGESRLLNKTQQQPTSEPTPPTSSSTQSGSADKSQLTKVEEIAGDTSSKSAPARNGQAASSSSATQTAAALVQPSNAMTIHTAPAPMSLHDDIPASPATVASAIEEVLKNGGANGAQTEDDDAWLARIHLLNGGQNMPNFGGFGPNGISGLGGEAEAQAAKKAERAVAAAWGAGKSVWNKSQQHQQQQQQQHQQTKAPTTEKPPAPKFDSSAGSTSAAVVTRDDAAKSEAEAVTRTHSTPSVNGVADNAKQVNDARTADEAEVAASDKAEKLDKISVRSKKTPQDKSQSSAETSKAGKGASSQPKKATTLAVPSFEDVNNWPSPLDAGKKPAEKKAPSTASDATTQPKTAKSFIETLDELQLRLAPGANAQQSSAASGARKGKQQWVSILPDITHNSANAAPTNKANRPASEVKTGKGANKQPRSSDAANKKGGQAQPAQGAKKDKEGANKGATKSQGKEGGNEASGSTKVSESKNKGENLTQVPVQGDAARSKDSTAASTPARPATTETKPKDSVGASGSGESKTIATPSEAATSQAASKQQPRAPRINAKQTGSATNGVSTPSYLSLPTGNGPNGVPPPHQQRGSGASTPSNAAPNRSSPRASISTSTPPTSASFVPTSTPLYYSPNASAAPGGQTQMMTQQWLPYLPYPPTLPSSQPSHHTSPSLHHPTTAIAYLSPDATTQTGAPLPATPLLNQLLAQIEFYFSQHNLQGDFFLRSKMDAKGWVDIMGVVMGFKRVQGLTGGDKEMVKEALSWSAVLEVDWEMWRVRRRWGWEGFVLPPSSEAAQPMASEGEGGVEGEKQAIEVERSATDPQQQREQQQQEEDDEPLGVVSASGFGGALEA